MHKKSIKIFTAHHKEFIQFHDDVLTPIHVGAKLSTKKLNMIRDDSGDNISELNPFFCELTAHYWIWKNDLNYDYVGMTHYRRLFNFNEDTKKIADKPIIYDDIVILNDNTIEDFKHKYGLSSETIKEYINQEQNSNVDVFLHNPETMTDTIRNQFQKNHYKNGLHLNQAIEILLKKYPEYTDSVETFFNQCDASLFNMFIMKKKVFDDYSKWLFSILFELYDTIDYTHLTPQSSRVCGHIAERFFNIYVQHNNLVTKTLDVIKINNVQEKPVPESSNSVPIVLSINETDVKHAMVLIQSIIDNITTNKTYEFLILANRIHEESIFLLNMMSQKQVKIKILHMNDMYSKIQTAYLNDETITYPNISIYSQIFIPVLLSHYKKVLYMDIDTICLTDVAEFLEIELDDKLIGAVSDYIFRGFIKSQKDFNVNDKIYKLNDYIINYLGLKNAQDYFQAGVMIFNIQNMENSNILHEILTLRKTKESLILETQDLLNMYFKNRVKYMDMSWNITPIHNKMPSANDWFFGDEAYEYHIKRSNAKIIHYQGPVKPWNEKSDLTALWCFYANQLGLSTVQPKPTSDIQFIKNNIHKKHPLIYHSIKYPYRILRNLYHKFK